jgi:hypothetical protein
MFEQPEGCLSLLKPKNLRCASRLSRILELEPAVLTQTLQAVHYHHKTIVALAAEERFLYWKEFPQRPKPIEVVRVMYELKLVPFNSDSLADPFRRTTRRSVFILVVISSRSLTAQHSPSLRCSTPPLPISDVIWRIQVK